MPAFMQPISVSTATFALNRGHAGTDIILNRAGGIALTLPAPEAGLEFRFVVGTAPTTSCTVATAGGANVLAVGINELEVDTGDDGPYLADGDTITFVENIAAVGDFVSIRADGSKWFGHGQANLDGGITITKT